MPPHSENRNYLMVVHTLLSLRYLNRHLSALNSTNTRWTFTQTPDDFGNGVAEALQRLPHDVVPLRQAIASKWDAAFFAAHYPHPDFDPTVPKIHIQHGLGSGKRVGEHDYTYGPATTLKPDGIPRYDLMLEASTRVRDAAIERNPALRGCIQVVGDLFCDDVLAANSRRNEIRQSIGIGPSERVVFMSSTWGPNGMLASQGDWLLQQVQNIPSDHRVMMTLHPHIWAQGGVLVRELIKSTGPNSRFQLVPSSSSWVNPMVVSDTAIVDHSSQGLFWALLNRPTIAAPVTAEVINAGTLIEELRQRSVQIDTHKSAWTLAEDAGRNHDAARGTYLASEITSYPGTAESRINIAVDRVVTRGAEQTNGGLV